MPPAARVGDQTSHGTPLSPGLGSPNVFISGRPAWRVLADSHTCPLSDPGPKPHIGGKLQSESTRVFINNFPAARKGDIVTEVGPGNSIVSGARTVIIG
jgi:hypothetical protein